MEEDQTTQTQETAENTPASSEKPAGQKTAETQAESPKSFEELLGGNKEFQSWLDKKITAATNTALSNAQRKWEKQKTNDLSESEKLQAMTAEQKAEYFEKKFKEAEQSRIRDKEIEDLKSQTTAMLTENKIPEVFLSVFDFGQATAEDIKERVAMLSEYEYYPKGAFEKSVKAALNEKLKQKTPETHKSTAPASDNSLREKFGLPPIN